jgi:cytidylate kinase
LGGTIFVGRGAHLVLPRERVLAVRFIASRDQRISRLARMLNITEEKAEVKLDEGDTDRRNFYISVYGKRDAAPYEFDLVINCDHINEPGVSAELVENAFQGRFGRELDVPKYN